MSKVLEITFLEHTGFAEDEEALEQGGPRCADDTPLGPWAIVDRVCSTCLAGWILNWSDSTMP
jgi:hypothetical protein